VRPLDADSVAALARARGLDMSTEDANAVAAQLAGIQAGVAQAAQRLGDPRPADEPAVTFEVDR
jgi:hypothetical protein